MTAGGAEVAAPVVALLGAGAMGGAVVTGLVRAGRGRGDLMVVERDAERLEALAAGLGLSYGDLAADLPAAATADVVVVAVKPAQVPGMIDDLTAALAARPGGRGPVVVSLAAGLTTRFLERHLPAGTAVVRVMPNTPALVGEGASALSAGSHAGDADIDLADSVMSAVGTTVRIPEHLQDAVTALSGSGPAYVFYVVDAMTEGGVLLGLDRATARALAVRTVLGSARLLDETGRPPAELREQVTSPAGTTAEALRVLDEDGVRAAVLRAMRAARDRSVELGRASDG